MALSAEYFSIGAQRIGSFHGTVLAGVTRENYAALVGFRQAQELVHLLAADLPGLINQQHATARQRHREPEPR